MNERSIAEILGWVPIRWAGTDSDQVIRWQAPDVDYSDGSPPTVDDLLAWLSENLFMVDFEVYGDPPFRAESWDVYANYRYVVSYGDERPRFLQACKPTLLEAFECIVRAADSHSSSVPDARVDNEALSSSPATPATSDGAPVAAGAPPSQSETTT